MKKAELALQLRTFGREAALRANSETERSLFEAVGDYSAEMLYGLRTKRIVWVPSSLSLISLEGRYKRAGIGSPGISIMARDGQIQQISLYCVISYKDNSWDWLVAPGVGNIYFDSDGTIKADDGAEGEFFTREEILARVPDVLQRALDKKDNLRRFR